MATQFDTLNYMKRLESAGVPAGQAEVHAFALNDALREAVVHPRDIDTLKLSMNDRFDMQAAGLAAVNARLDLMDKQNDARFNQIDERFDKSDDRQDNFERSQAESITKIRVDIKEVIGEIHLLKWMTASAFVLSMTGITLCAAMLFRLMPLLSR